MTPRLSIVICTYNPRLDFLGRTLDSLRAQTLDLGDWELLLVDNASTNDWAKSVELAWHPKARIVKEEKIGLTMARLRGIQEASGELLLFVDDDNVLAPDYAERVIEVADRHRQLGCFGAGQIVPEFEEPPSADLRRYTEMLALRVVGSPQWSNNLATAMPYGAGMAVRRDVALQYHRTVASCAVRVQLDRKGSALNSGGDDEFSWVASEIGCGIGVFPELSLTHLIDRRRVQQDYLLRLAEGHAFSHRLLDHLHGVRKDAPMPEPSLVVLVKYLITARVWSFLNEALRYLSFRQCSSTDRKFLLAKIRGHDAAVQFINSLGQVGCKRPQSPISSARWSNSGVGSNLEGHVNNRV